MDLMDRDLLDSSWRAFKHASLTLRLLVLPRPVFRDMRIALCVEHVYFQSVLFPLTSMNASNLCLSDDESFMSHLKFSSNLSMVRHPSLLRQPSLMSVPIQDTVSTFVLAPVTWIKTLGFCLSINMRLASVKFRIVRSCLGMSQ